MTSSPSDTNNSMRTRIPLYALAIFLSSAGLMALEIAAARLLAPYIGVSLYSWTAIIGVVLGGLSIGNWLGGIWADRGADEGAAGGILGAGALACLAVLLLLTLIAAPLQASELGLLSVTFLFVAALFFLPSVLLGVVTPLLTTLALRLDTRTGHIVGMLHALAAFGSIVGTFATGFLLIQYFGTRAVILGTAGMLGLLSILFLRRRWLAVAPLILLTALIIPLTSARGGFVDFCDRETNYFCIRIVDMSHAIPRGQARGMILDHLLHGISHREDPTLLLAPYTHLMDELITRSTAALETRPLRVFFAGGGSYTQPRALRARHADAEIVIAELDPAVTQMAEQHLYYEAAPDRILHFDARRALHRQAPQHFDVIVGDVFHDIAIPHHLITREHAELVRSRLTADGLYVLNVVDAHPDPRLVKSLIKTLNSVFPTVQVWLDHWPEQLERMTYVLSARNGAPFAELVSARQGAFVRTWTDVTTQLLESGTALADLPVLTDDRAPVENLLSTLIFGTLGR